VTNELKKHIEMHMNKISLNHGTDGDFRYRNTYGRGMVFFIKNKIFN
jgi:hypothetical protein